MSDSTTKDDAKEKDPKQPPPTFSEMLVALTGSKSAYIPKRRPNEKGDRNGSHRK
jgi:hypothetical protein